MTKSDKILVVYIIFSILYIIFSDQSKYSTVFYYAVEYWIIASMAYMLNPKGLLNIFVVCLCISRFLVNILFLFDSRIISYDTVSLSIVICSSFFVLWRILFGK